MTQALKPVEVEVYRTPDNKKLFIILCYDKNMIFYYLYSYKNTDDCIVAGIDGEWLAYKKREFVETRGLKFVKKESLKNESKCKCKKLQ